MTSNLSVGTEEKRWCVHCHVMTWFRFSPSPDAGPYWRCSECGETQKRNDGSECEPVLIDLPPARVRGWDRMIDRLRDILGPEKKGGGQ